MEHFFHQVTENMSLDGSTRQACRGPETQVGDKINQLIERSPISLENQWKATWSYLARLLPVLTDVFFLDEVGQTTDRGQWRCGWLRGSQTRGCFCALAPLKLKKSCSPTGLRVMWPTFNKGSNEKTGDVYKEELHLSEAGNWLCGKGLSCSTMTQLSLLSSASRSPGFFCLLLLWFNPPDGMDRSSLPSTPPQHLYAPPPQ